MPGPSEVKRPTIKVDTILAKLYKHACPNDASIRLGWVSCGVTSGVDLTPGFPRNAKFINGDQDFITG